MKPQDKLNRSARAHGWANWSEVLMHNAPAHVINLIVEEAMRGEPVGKPPVRCSVAVKDALAFAEYFHNNFDYYDCNANGRIYKWIDLQERGKSAMTMKQIFEYWVAESDAVVVG